MMVVDEINIVSRIGPLLRVAIRAGPAFNVSVGK